LLFWLSVIEPNPYDKDKTFDKDGMASVWLRFVARLRLIAEMFPSRLGYIDALIDNLGLEKPFSV